MRRITIAAALLTATLTVTATACSGDDDEVTTKPDTRSADSGTAKDEAEKDKGGNASGAKDSGAKDSGEADKDETGQDAEEAEDADKPQVAAVGDTITVKGFENGEQLAVTVKKFLDPAKGADEFNQPQSGKKWVAAQFELKNTGTKVYADSPGNGAQVADVQGQRFDAWFGEISAGPSMTSDANVPPGEKALGWIVFEIPTSSKITTVQFAMNSGFAQQTGQWKVS
ncbi:DUF4352 domain-containing protein [Streptomyces sp. NA04227]|uniref:DUF4352 domain-containing protein n=1 Tax=Streptomyces sp. NA04227 TaxID=2742136 RepID=UPI00159085CE|nr:DUF4352 domain-containing protein [Streptomyces sp. NA04227]QKW08264.1 DUF4352 domain-containing protein [Streptomyces sp. NA04227]